MRIVLAGIIGRYPWGGVTWCSLMYLLGLRSLGHDVYYLEDTRECNYDPEIDAIATDPGYALRYIDQSLSPFALGDRWCYVDCKDVHHGIEANEWKKICESTDLFLVLSGGCWEWRDHYLKIPTKAFIDSDPGFTQLALHKAGEQADKEEKKNWYVDYFKTYDRLFTFGKNIGTAECDIPVEPFTWRPTYQPICVNLWYTESSGMPARKDWTTIMTWEIESFTDIGGNKDEEFLKVLDLPNRLTNGYNPDFELAVNGPKEFLREHGWPCTNAFDVSSDLWRYRNYIQSSGGEFSVAKHTYVKWNTGWFSDRTACYLASGRPAVVQETGLSRHLPTGLGLLTWRNLEEAIECVESVEANYPNHALAASQIAHEHLDGSRILSTLLDECG